MLAVPAVVFLSNPGSPSKPVSVVRTSTQAYAGPGARVLRVAELSRRVPVTLPPPTVPVTEAPTTTEAPPTTVAAARVTPTTEAPTTTRAPTTTTTAAPKPEPQPEPESVAVKAAAPSSSGSQGGATWYHAPDGTCAHRTLPFGTVVTVTRMSTGGSTSCRVADRGPFVSGMVIDLSMDTFANIASTEEGIVQVQLSW
jgi:rare lipoprotein A (peptidoglycan hydrolase)